MKQLLTTIAIIASFVVYGQKTTADVKDTSFVITGRTSNMLIMQGFATGRKPKITLTDSFSFWYKDKEYHASEVIEMIEWFREFKKLIIKPTTVYNNGTTPRTNIHPRKITGITTR